MKAWMKTSRASHQARSAVPEWVRDWQQGRVSPDWFGGQEDPSASPFHAAWKPDVYGRSHGAIYPNQPHNNSLLRSACGCVHHGFYVVKACQHHANLPFSSLGSGDSQEKNESSFFRPFIGMMVGYIAASWLLRK